MSHLMNEHKEGFYAAIKMINENFNKIAYIDFVKRVAMNEANGKTADVFRIKNNIFVTTSNAALYTVSISFIVIPALSEIALINSVLFINFPFNKFLNGYSH